MRRTLRAPPLRVTAALACALSGGVHAAAIELRSVGAEVLLCRVEHRCAHGNAFVATPAWQWVVGFMSVRFELGAQVEAVGDDSPSLASLTLRCVRRASMAVGELPQPDEPSYSIELDRFDPLWRVPAPGLEQWTSQLPRDTTVVTFWLGASGSPLRPLRIVDAMIRGEHVWPGWAIRYQLGEHDYRFVPDASAASRPP